MRSKKSASQKLTVVLLSVILVLCCTIGGTLAWLSAESQTVTNTFTVGDINISLAETTGENYKILPGGESDKNPEVTVQLGSEKCYVYVLIDNTVVLNNAVVATPDISADDWQVVQTSGTKTLYRYKEVVDAMDAEKTLPVFTKVTYADTISKDDITTLTNTKIIINAFAHQSENIDNESVADDAAKDHFGMTTTP